MENGTTGGREWPQRYRDYPGQIISGAISVGVYHTGSHGPHTGSHGHGPHTGSHGPN